MDYKEAEWARNGDNELKWARDGGNELKWLESTVRWLAGWLVWLGFVGGDGS